MHNSASVALALPPAATPMFVHRLPQRSHAISQGYTHVQDSSISVTYGRHDKRGCDDLARWATVEKSTYVYEGTLQAANGLPSSFPTVRLSQISPLGLRQP